MRLNWRNNNYDKHNNNNNIAFAISFAVILLASSTLTGSSLGKVSLTQPFGQQQQQEIPLKLWSIDSSPTDFHKQHRDLPATTPSQTSVRDNNIVIDSPNTFKINHSTYPKSMSSSIYLSNTI